MASKQEQDRRSRGDRSAHGQSQRQNGTVQLSEANGGKCRDGKEKQRTKTIWKSPLVDLDRIRSNKQSKVRQTFFVDVYDVFQVEIMKRQGISCNGKNTGNVVLDIEAENRSPPPSATPMDLIRNPNIRKKFFILAFDWVANAVVYNGLSYNTTNLGVSDYLAFFIGIDYQHCSFSR